jgi:hypothetical protein
MKRLPLTTKYGYLWATLAWFLFSIIGHWIFAWYAFVQEQAEHGQSPEVSEYLITVIRDTLENWQSEFLQLMWQVGGLAYLLYVGSPQSKEGDERKEAKLDLILKRLDPDHADSDIKKLDQKFQRA